MGIRSHRYASFDDRLFNVRVGNHHICCNLAIDHARAIGQDCPLPDSGITLENDIGFNDSFCPYFDIYIDIGGFWIGEGYSIDHVFLIDSLTHDGFRCGQSNPVIDSEAFIKITQDVGSDLLPRLAEDGDDIGQIVFPLGIVCVNLFQGFKKALVFKEIGPRVDFLDLFFKIIGILLLHNLDNFSICVADNTAIAKGIVSLSC